MCGRLIFCQFVLVAKHIVVNAAAPKPSLKSKKAIFESALAVISVLFWSNHLRIPFI